MAHKTRPDVNCGDLLDARGWLSCWVGDLPNEMFLREVRAGNLRAAIAKIDAVLKRLGHVGNGQVRVKRGVLVGGGRREKE
jgi:hypothetical protein